MAKECFELQVPMAAVPSVAVDEYHDVSGSGHLVIEPATVYRDEPGPYVLLLDAAGIR